MSRFFKKRGNVTFAEAAANIEAMAEAAPMATAGALYAQGTKLLNEAIPLTPMDTGALRNSGFVGFDPDGSRIKVNVGFGGNAAPYALAVHEMGDGTNWSEPGTGAKYLERPFDRMKGNLARNVAASLESDMRRNNYTKPPKGDS